MADEGKRERILFVDDEQRVLDALRRMLRGMRNEWDMLFVPSGRQALEVMDAEPVSVVISDMRMPQMNGEQLLREVATRNPDALRIVLSGQSDQEAIYRSMNIAHQYLTKPCDGETIREVIARACALRDTLADDDLKQMLARLNSLPSPPEVYKRLLAELQNPEASIACIGELIATDVSLSARVLRLVNSALFSLNTTITEPAHAVLMLGMETVRTLLMSVHLFAQFEGHEDCERLVQQVSEHSVAVASLAKRIAVSEKAERTMANHAFTAGMMHEVGLLVLAVNEPDQVGDVLRLSERKEISPLEAERRLLPATHAQMGAYLLGLWGMPNPILEAVAFVENPSSCPTSEFSPLVAVHVADALIHELSGCPLRGHGLDRGFLADIGLEHRLTRWRELIHASDDVPAADHVRPG